MRRLVNFCVDFLILVLVMLAFMAAIMLGVAGLSMLASPDAEAEWQPAEVRGHTFLWRPLPDNESVMWSMEGKDHLLCYTTSQDWLDTALAEELGEEPPPARTVCLPIKGA